MVEKSHIAGGLGTDWWPSIYAPLGRFGRELADWLAPRADAAARQDCYEINVELPGVSADNVDVSIEENMLTVKGEKRHAHDEAGRSYFFSEREYGAFQRSFRLPTDTQADKITASFKEGVLTVRVPKAGPPPETSRRVKVQTA
jgi:HSP20 family protein